MIQLNTRNSKYENEYYPGTKVKFRRRRVQNPNGETLEGVFADFSAYSIFEVILPQAYWDRSDKEQFNYCLDQLRNHFRSNQRGFERKLLSEHHLLIDNDLNTLHGKVLDSSEILEKQVNDIINTKSVQKGRFYGYTWHHTENLGEMQLVPDFIHKLVSHDGGKKVWGADR